MGEAASPVCFELAKRLKKAPRQIAQEIQNALPPIPGIAKVDVAGAGYLNAYFDRAAFWEAAQSEPTQPKPRSTAPAKLSSNTPASTPTKRRTSAMCATPSWATPWRERCATPDTTCKSKTISITPA